MSIFHPKVTIEDAEKKSEAFAVKASTSRELAPQKPESKLAARDKNQALERIEAMEDQLFNQSSTILTSALDAFDLEETASQPPPEWVEEYGEAGAWKRFRAAKAALMSAAAAPVALKIAAQLVTTMTKAKADKQEAPSLNVVINVPTPNGALEKDAIPVIVLSKED